MYTRMSLCDLVVLRLLLPTMCQLKHLHVSVSRSPSWSHCPSFLFWTFFAFQELICIIILVVGPLCLNKGKGYKVTCLFTFPFEKSICPYGSNQRSRQSSSLYCSTFPFVVSANKPAEDFINLCEDISTGHCPESGIPRGSQV